MAIAFASFDEPHAWLLRGLVEYGWPDWSRAKTQSTPAGFGGIDLRPWMEGDGRDGIVLAVPAQAQGRPCVDDGVYTFTVQVQRRQGGIAAIVRCPEANFFQEFPYDPYNPTWAAGYIHQSLQSYVPQYVAWRLAGGELGWAQREGVPKVAGEPASAGLISFLRGRLQANSPLELLWAEGWAVGRPGQVGSTGIPLPRVVGGASAPLTPPSPTSGIVAGAGSNEPLYLSAAARDALARGETRPGLPQNDAVQAKARTRKPANALLTMSALTGIQSLFWLADSFTIVAWYRDSLGALLFSLPLFLVLLPASAIAAYGAWQMREVRTSPLPWVSMAVAALSPVCCIAGVPLAYWAAKAWMDPMVVAVRTPRTTAPGAPTPPAPFGPGLGAGGLSGAHRGIQGPQATARPRNAIERGIDAVQRWTKKLPF